MIRVLKLTGTELLRLACESTMHGQKSSMTLAQIYQCEHSPIRTQLFWIELRIPTFVSVHLVRHKVGVEHFVETNRDDRGGVKADRWTPVKHSMLINAQALIQMARKRLCRKAHPTTRALMQDIRFAIKEVDPDLFDYMVSECVYRGKCHEILPCYAQSATELSNCWKESKPMKELTVFEYGMNEVRVINQDGKPWFVAKDVCDVLGYSNGPKAVRDHCKHAKTLSQNESFTLTGQYFGINIIPEFDVYRLILRSNMPDAEAFRDWVCEEVLPAIRKTGAYFVGEENLPAEAREMLNMSKADMFRKLAEMVEANEQLQIENKVLAPKAEVHDILCESEGSVSLTEAFKLCDVPPRKAM